MEIRVKNCLYFLIFNIIYVVIIIIDWVKKGEAVENINEIEWDIEGIKLKQYLGSSEDILIPNRVYR